MVSYGFDHQVGLVACLVKFFAQCYACGGMIVKTFNSKIAKQPALGVMLKKNFTKPVYQKIRRVRPLNFNADFRSGLNGCWLRDQVREHPRSIFKHFAKRRAEGFKSNISGVFQNAKTRHGIVGCQAIA